MQLTHFPVPFVKMSGTGNDFIIIDHRQPCIHPEAVAEFAALVCRRKFSVGADGLILIEESETADFRWQFFNADGSVAEMCGNGARCAARFAYMHGIAPAKMSFETLAGVIEAQVADVQVAVKMTDPCKINLEQQVQVDGQELLLHCMDTGVPHVVLFVDDIDQIDVRTLGSSIRHHEAFMPAGTNVNFVQEREGAFKVRTYERGVEDETLACGTGAVAAALTAAMLGRAESPVEIITSGGDRLAILFDLKENGNAAENVFLKGPAHVIYKGELNAEALL